MDTLKKDYIWSVEEKEQVPRYTEVVEFRFSMTVEGQGDGLVYVCTVAFH